MTLFCRWEHRLRLLIFIKSNYLHSSQWSRLLCWQTGHSPYIHSCVNLSPTVNSLNVRISVCKLQLRNLLSVLYPSFGSKSAFYKFCINTKHLAIATIALLLELPKETPELENGLFFFSWHKLPSGVFCACARYKSMLK